MKPVHEPIAEEAACNDSKQLRRTPAFPTAPHICSIVSVSDHSLAHGLCCITRPAYRVVSWEVCWLVAGEVCEEQPVPACDHDILTLDVPVAHPMRMSLAHCMQQLERDPALQGGR